MPVPGEVTPLAAAVEPLHRPPPVIHQHDFKERCATVTHDRLDLLDLTKPAQVLGHDNITALPQVGMGHAERERPHDLAGLGEPVPPAAHQVAQLIYVEVEHTGMLVYVQLRERRFTDARRAVEMDQAWHRPEFTSAPASETVAARLAMAAQPSVRAGRMGLSAGLVKVIEETIEQRYERWRAGLHHRSREPVKAWGRIRPASSDRTDTCLRRTASRNS